MGEHTVQEPKPLLRVLLTGGPGAGKSSALATLRDRISKRGFQAVVVPENATTLLDNSGGYDPSWHGTGMHVKLQQAFLRFQMQQEDIYGSFAALRPGKPHILLHDRGCLDGRLFCTDQQWAQVLEGVGTSEEDLLKRYDLIIHMTSVALGMENLYDYGPGSSNPARYHTPEQARHADVLAQEIYAKHPHVRVVPNFPEFAKKMEAVVRCVTEAVQVDGLAGPRERSLLSRPRGEAPPVQAWPVDCEVYDIKVSFLDTDFTESVRRRELMPHGNSAPAGAEGPATLSEPPEVLYEFRHDVKLDGQLVHTRRVLTADAYALLMQSKTGSSVDLKKRAVCFTWEGNYYEVYSYMNKDGGPLPESCELSGCQVLDKPQGAPVPPFLEAVEASVESGATPAKQPQAGRSAFRRQLSRHATAEAAAFVEKALITPPCKRPRDRSPAADMTSVPRPLKRQASEVSEKGSLSKVAAVALSPIRVRPAERLAELTVQ